MDSDSDLFIYLHNSFKHTTDKHIKLRDYEKTVRSSKSVAFLLKVDNLIKIKLKPNKFGDYSNQNIIIYRHPNSDVILFQNKLCESLTKLEDDKLHYVINGDFNINLLKSNCAKVKNYQIMLDSVGCNSLIKSPTRFFTNCDPSLLDHIYSTINSSDEISGICFYDISDHLQTFLVMKNLQVSDCNKPIFRRTMKNFVIESLLSDLQEELQTIEISNPDISVNSISQKFDFLF